MNRIIRLYLLLSLSCLAFPLSAQQERASFLPLLEKAALVQRFSRMYPQEKAYKVEKIRGGYEVGITNGLELIFDSDWNFSRLDR